MHNRHGKSIVLVILMVFMAFAHGVKAQEVAVTTINGQTIVCRNSYSGWMFVSPMSGWENYGEPTGNLILPDSIVWMGNTYPVGIIASEAFMSCEGLTSVVIPSTVWRIGNNAFHSCTGLVSVTLPSSMSAGEWGGGIFAGCSSLSSVVFPDNATFIPQSIFSGCTSLTEFTIPNSIQRIHAGAFQFSGLTAINIPAGVVQILENAFSGCSNLSSISVEDGNANYDSRNGCNAIIKTNQNELVFGCRNTVIPSTVNRIGEEAFYFCTTLQSIEIPSNVTAIYDRAFECCRNLESVVMQSSTAPSLGSDAFSENAENRLFHIPCGAYDSYYNWWADYRDYLREPEVDYQVSVSPSDEAYGTANIVQQHGRDVSCDNKCIVEAIAYEGYSFDHWSTGVRSNPYTMIVTRDTAVTAYFVADTTHQEGIEDVDALNVRVYSSKGQVVVEGADDATLWVYDMAGRQVACEVSAGKVTRITVPASGTYMLKIGNRPARKVVVPR